MLIATTRYLESNPKQANIVALRDQLFERIRKSPKTYTPLLSKLYETLPQESVELILATAGIPEAIRLYPDDAYAYSCRGNAYREKGEYDQAIADYTEVIRINPDDADAYNNRGIAYRTLGKYAEADADKAKACSLDSKYC